MLQSVYNRENKLQGVFSMYQKVVDQLNELGIPFQIVEHEPVLTTEQTNRFIEGMEGIHILSILRIYLPS